MKTRTIVSTFLCALALAALAHGQKVATLTPPRAGFSFPQKQTLAYSVDWRVFPAGTAVLHFEAQGDRETENHRFSGHSYPHRPPAPPENVHETSDAPPIQRGGFVAADMDAALAQLHESYDIDREDLELLLRLAEARASSRRHGDVTCADIMSREVLCVDLSASLEEARETFELRALRRAPVIDSNGVVVGVLTPSSLSRREGPVGAVMQPALLVAPEMRVLDLAPKLADGRVHEAVVVDARRRVIGLVTQSDLLALTLRLLSVAG